MFKATFLIGSKQKSKYRNYKVLINKICEKLSTQQYSSWLKDSQGKFFSVL
jgi:hypothetical protein